VTYAPLTQLALTFSILSLGAVGGANVTLPELHRQMVDVSRYMDDATFASLVALAQTAPGPNVIVMSLMGWHIAGAAGLAVATAGMIAPSSVLAFAAERAFRRFSASRTV
jgi:chromate transporter